MKKQGNNHMFNIFDTDQRLCGVVDVMANIRDGDQSRDQSPQ